MKHVCAKNAKKCRMRNLGSKAEWKKKGGTKWGMLQVVLFLSFPFLANFITLSIFDHACPLSGHKSSLKFKCFFSRAIRNFPSNFWNFQPVQIQPPLAICYWPKPKKNVTKINEKLGFMDRVQNAELIFQPQTLCMQVEQVEQSQGKKKSQKNANLAINQETENHEKMCACVAATLSPHSLASTRDANSFPSRNWRFFGCWICIYRGEDRCYHIAMALKAHWFVRFWLGCLGLRLGCLFCSAFLFSQKQAVPDTPLPLPPRRAAMGENIDVVCDVTTRVLFFESLILVGDEQYTILSGWLPVVLTDSSNPTPRPRTDPRQSVSWSASHISSSSSIIQPMSKPSLQLFTRCGGASKHFTLMYAQETQFIKNI